MGGLYSLTVRPTSKHKVGTGTGPTLSQAPAWAGVAGAGAGAGLGRQRQEDLKFEDSLDYSVNAQQKTKKANLHPTMRSGY